MTSKYRVPKILAVSLLTLALMMQLCFSALIQVSAAEGSNVILNFDSWTDTSAVAQDQDPVAYELVDQGGGDKALKMTTGSSAGTIGTGNVGMAPATTDWSGSMGLSVYMENLSADAPLAVRLMFFANNTTGQTDLWSLAHDAAYSMVSGETVTPAKTTYGFVVLPAGFKGTVNVPFAAFAGQWYGSQAAAMNTAAGGLIYCTFDTVNYLGMSLLVDDISLMKAPAAPVVEDFSTWVDTSRAVAEGGISYTLTNTVRQGNALKLTLPETSSADSGNIGFSPVVLDWSGKGGLQLYMKNLSDAPLAVSVRFIAKNETQPELWSMAAQTASIRLIQGDTVTESNTTSGVVTLPANFDGYVQLPFAEFTGGWYGSQNSQLDLATVTAMYLFYDTRADEGYLGKSMLLDEISLISALSDVTPVNPGTSSDAGSDSNASSAAPPDTGSEASGAVSSAPALIEKTVENFDGMADTSAIQADQDPISYDLIADAKGGKALKLSVVGTQTNPVGVGNVGFTPTLTDWSAGKGLKMYLKNLSNDNLAVRIMFIDGTKGDLWTAAHQTPVTFTSMDGKETAGELVYGFVLMPANFEGYVSIPFSAFSGSWHGTANKDLDLSNISAMYASFDTSAAAGYCGKSMVLDEISLYGVEVPKTGEELPLGLIAVLLVSAAVLTVAFFCKRREAEAHAE